MLNNVKEFLFDKYSKNLDEILNLSPDIKRPSFRIYMCPLCRLVFSEKDLDQNNKNPLTIEHIPPESVGGKEIILTCKKCNNDHGSKFDSHVSEKLRLKKILSSKQASKDTLNSKVKFTIENDIKSNGHIFLDENDQFNFVLEERRTNPKYHKNIIDIIAGNKGDVKMKFEFETFNETNSLISILRSAYLKAFKELGYAFLLNSNSEIIRKRIVVSSVDFGPINGIFVTTGNNFVQGLSVITSPENLQGYLVGLRISKDGFEELYNIFLPGGNSGGKHLYDELDKMKTHNNMDQCNLQLTLLEGEDFVSGDNKFFALQFWGENYGFHKGKSDKPLIS